MRKTSEERRNLRDISIGAIITPFSAPYFMLHINNPIWSGSLALPSNLETKVCEF